MQNQISKLVLKKLSISEDEAKQVKELLEEGRSHYKISSELNIARSKIWRNVQVMGLGKKKKIEIQKVSYFRWEDFDNSVI